ncbi:MAG TPA: zf-HC2 domain-containing protein [Acidobacteriota bacterium]|nr:zf-HC2 domain-containing protein [Acidobacteriota bacterium]
MSGCSLEMLARLLDKKLGLDEKLEIFDHLDGCKGCREAVHRISRDRDKALLIYRPLLMNKSPAA